MIEELLSFQTFSTNRLIDRQDGARCYCGLVCESLTTRFAKHRPNRSLRDPRIPFLPTGICIHA